MKVLVIGSGGREHALVWALEKSPRVTEVVCAPGNGGIAEVARCVPVNLKDLNDLVRVVAAEQSGLDGGGAGAAAFAGVGGRAAAARDEGLWADQGGGDAGDEQGLCEAVHAAAQHSDGELCGVRERSRRLRSRCICFIFRW